MERKILNQQTVSNSIIAKIIAEYLIHAVRQHRIDNIGFFIDYDDTLYAQICEDGETVEDNEDCVHVIDLGSIDLRAIEHIFPDSFEDLDIAFFYHEMHDRFPEVEEHIDEAVSCLTEGSWLLEDDEEFLENFFTE